MARQIQVPVQGALDQVGAARRDHDLFARVFQRLNQPLLRVIGFVRQDGIRRGVRQQDIGAGEVVGLAGGEVKPGRIAQSVHLGMDLRAQSTAATSDGLAYFRPLPEGTGTVRVSTNEGRIHPDPLVVRLFRPSAKHALPHPRLAPAREPEVHHAEIPETFGQGAPRDAGSISVPHGFHKQALVCGSDPHVLSTSRQPILDAVPWVVSQCVSLFHRSILRRLGSAQRG